MTTELRFLYEMLKCFSTATHRSMCDDLLRRLDAAGPGPTLAEWFSEALDTNASFSNVDQPFLNPKSLKDRKEIGPGSRGDNRIVHLLASKGQVSVVGGYESYCFWQVNRQVPPMRQERAGDPTSGAGGIDYTAKTSTRPVLGEIKVDSDENPFYAFVQLLTYLAELATEKQVARANQHQEFKLSLVYPQAFDLHILLADFNDRGTKGELIDLTRRLAEATKKRLADRHPFAAAVVGSILCLRMTSASFAQTGNSSLDCIWAV